MLKKAQISMFLVIGVLLILVVVLVELAPKEEEVAPTISAVTSTTDLEMQQFVENCMQIIGETGIYHTMLQGGYTDAPSESSNFYNVQVAHYWKDKINLMPSKAEVEEQLSLFMQDNLRYCVNGFLPFEMLGYSVSSPAYFELPDTEEFDEILFEEIRENIRRIRQGEAQLQYGIDATITNNGVLFTITDPITLIREDQEQTISSFQTEIPINVQAIFTHATQIMNEQHLSPNSVPISTLSRMSNEHDFRFEVFHYDDNSVIIGLIYEIPDKENLIFSFMQQYNWDTANTLTFEGP